MRRAALIMAAALMAALLGLILWDTPEAPAYPAEYREDTAHYLTKDGELIPWEEYHADYENR